MIHRLSANQPSFHEVTFKKGLNLVLAERAENATEKDTRNGLGKSTLIEIIDFCLGSRTKKGRGIIIDDLEGWAFTLEVTLRGNRVKGTRSVDNPGVVIVEGPTNGWPKKPEFDEEIGKQKPDLLACSCGHSRVLTTCLHAEIVAQFHTVRSNGMS